MKTLLKNWHSYQSPIGSQHEHNISTKDNNGEEGEGGNHDNRDDDIDVDEYGRSLCLEITKANSFTSLQDHYHIALSTRSHRRQAQTYILHSIKNQFHIKFMINHISFTSMPPIPISGTQQHFPILLLPLFPKLRILATVFPLFSLCLRFKKNQGLFYIIACLIYL